MMTNGFLINCIFKQGKNVWEHTPQYFLNNTTNIAVKCLFLLNLIVIFI